MNWSTKRVLPTPALEAADPALTLAYRLWADLREDGYLPARFQIDTPQFRLMIPQTQWLGPVNATESEPLQLDGFKDAIVAQFNNEESQTLLSDALAEDLRLTKFTGSPLFQVVELADGSDESTLQLLFLPFADDGLRVSEILVLSRVGSFTLDIDHIPDEVAVD